MMFQWTIFYICLFASLTLQQQCNSPTPLSFPIRNVTLQNSVVRRGLPIEIGTPPQQLTLAIDGDWNNTVVYTGNGGCDTSTTASQCILNRGGMFQTDASTSMKLSEHQGNETDIPDEHNTYVGVSLGNDTLNFNSTFKIPGFELKEAGPENNIPQSLLGFGRDSTLLERLYADKKILSRSWSLFWGLEGGEEADQMDGSLVLGGYDKAKTSGNNFTGDFAINSGCPSSMLIFLEDIRLDFPNGTQASLFANQGQGSAMRSCIKPDVQLITLPSEVYQQFMNSIGGTYIGPSETFKRWGMDFSADGAFPGNLTFVLASGLALTIPNHQLVIPEVNVTSTGQLIPGDPSRREIPIYNFESVNADDMPLLGQLFLTSVYLHVNNDESTFTLWQANPTRDENLVTVGKATDCATTPKNPGPSVTPEKKKSGSGLSTTIIAGATTGAVVGAAALILLIVLFTRKRRSVFQLSGPKSPTYDTFKEIVHEAAPSGGSIEGGFGQPHELPWRPIYEMPVPSARASSRAELDATNPDDTPPLLPPKDHP